MDSGMGKQKNGLDSAEQEGIGCITNHLKGLTCSYSSMVSLLSLFIYVRGYCRNILKYD